MRIQGKITDISLDYVMHKPRIVFQLTSQLDLLTDEFNKLKEEELLDIEIGKHRQKRSTQANAYCWELISKIADIIGSTKEEVYRDYIHNKGIFRIITMSTDAVDTFKKIWQEKGLGWLCETSETNIPGLTDVVAYYGSSCYDTKQMSVFIDYIVQEAKNLGIQTESPEEIQRMKDMWVPSK